MKNIRLKYRIRRNTNTTRSGVQPVSVSIFRAKHCLTPGLAMAHAHPYQPSTLAGASHSQHIPRSRNLFLYIFLIHFYFSMSANFSTCSPPCSHWHSHMLLFIQHWCLQTGTYSFPFIIQAGSLTPCLPLASGFYAEDYSAFSLCCKFLPCPTECQALVVIHQQCITAFCVMPVSWHGKDFPLIFQNRTGPWKALQDLACFCKLLILLKDSKISKTSTHLHLWKPVLKAELDMRAQTAGRTILWWEQIWARLWEQTWFTGKFCCHADPKCHLWSPRTGERAQPSYQRAMQIQITML